jgi:hypothetical protein
MAQKKKPTVRKNKSMNIASAAIKKVKNGKRKSK